jgi:hypothetical protein
MNGSYYNPRASGNWPIIKQVACYHRLESGMLEMYYVRYAIFADYTTTLISSSLSTLIRFRL